MSKSSKTIEWLINRGKLPFFKSFNELGLTPKARIQLRLEKKHRKTLGDMIVESAESEDHDG